MIMTSDMCRGGGGTLTSILVVQRILLKYLSRKTFDYTRPYMPPRCYLHSDIPLKPPYTRKMHFKLLRGSGEAEICLVRPLRTFLERCTDRNHQSPGRFYVMRVFLGDRFVCVRVRCL